ncbi:hypothetical protein, partial [Thioclava dalianensis]|uniref:hypothetical protein n=1 Tax=Thioclava dalianensis TaxID=1185766 RepID=UPI001B804802
SSADFCNNAQQMQPHKMLHYNTFRDHPVETPLTPHWSQSRNGFVMRNMLKRLVNHASEAV